MEYRNKWRTEVRINRKSKHRRLHAEEDAIAAQKAAEARKAATTDGGVNLLDGLATREISLSPPSARSGWSR